MATCLHCTTELTGRTKVCDACKARVARPAKRSKPRAVAVGSAPARKPKPKGVAPDGLRDRGRALWSSLRQTAGTAAGELALEACRLADRLERIDAMLAGRDDWFELVEVEQGTFVLRVDNLLDQGRQQALAFKQLLAELGINAVPAAPVEPAKSPLDQLRERREQKAAK